MNTKQLGLLLLSILVISTCIVLIKFKIIYVDLGFAKITDEYNEPVIYENFITEEEANYIKQQAEPKFSNSEIMGFKINEEIRKSKTAWLDKNDPNIKNVIMRVCAIHDYPFENAEQLQVVKYEPGGFYKEHHDSVYETDSISINFLKDGGHRMLTMLIYLNDDFTGGSTRFVTLQKDIRPPKHGSILFYPLDKTNTKCHPKALHAGLPLNSGVKYIANVWIRKEEYNDSWNTHVIYKT